MIDDPQQLVAELSAAVGRVVLGKPEIIRLCLTALLAGEHVLLEDVPGVGKTLLGKALARSIAGQFARLQFTPDLLPSDILGGSVFDARTAEFIFKPGPIFANVVLADEINRAPPRTQSALLEAMNEGQVSLDGQTHPLPRPFFVIATQNPFEFEGTYPLPESQLDRFLLRTAMGYPPRAEERQAVLRGSRADLADQLAPVIDAAQVVDLQQLVRQVTVDATVADYLLDIVEATRRRDDLHIGVSTRGAVSLCRAAQAWAFLDGRGYVLPDDIKRLAAPTLAHRVIPKGILAGGRREIIEELIRQTIASVAAPT